MSSKKHFIILKYKSALKRAFGGESNKKEMMKKKK
jgi:hypothetical protein